MDALTRDSTTTPMSHGRDLRGGGLLIPHDTEVRFENLYHYSSLLWSNQHHQLLETTLDGTHLQGHCPDPAPRPS